MICRRRCPDFGPLLGSESDAPADLHATGCLWCASRSLSSITNLGVWLTTVYLFKRGTFSMQCQGKLKLNITLGHIDFQVWTNKCAAETLATLLIKEANWRPFASWPQVNDQKAISVSWKQHTWPSVYNKPPAFPPIQCDAFLCVPHITYYILPEDKTPKLGTDRRAGENYHWKTWAQVLPWMWKVKLVNVCRLMWMKLECRSTKSFK